jgi:pimeloyl-ACP methyl ester carboxylesterase
MIKNLSIVSLVVTLIACSAMREESGYKTSLSFWPRAERTQKLIVFVHGFNGNPHDTWTNRSGKSWMELMNGDNMLREFTVATLGYYTPLLSRASTIEELSTRLLSYLHDRRVFEEYREIYFVTHSMGGLLVKRMLTDLHRPNEIKKLRQVKAVLFISTPAQGASVAEIGSWFSENPQLRDMGEAELNSFIQSVENQWQNLMRERGAAQFPRSFCAYETLPIRGLMIVNRIYAATSCDHNPIGFDENHVNIVKPLGIESDVYIWARSRIQDASNLAKGLSSSPSFESRIEDLLRRNEFLPERGKQIGTATFIVQLKRPYSPDELGHFRILLEVTGRGTKDSSPATLSFAARDAYQTVRLGQQTKKRDGMLQSVWSKNPDISLPGLVFSGLDSVSGPNMWLLQVSREIKRTGPFQTIESLDHTVLNIFVSESLADKLEFVGFIVNNYLLMGLRIDCIEQTRRKPVEWPFKLSPSEERIGWLNLLPRRYWPDDDSRPPFRPSLIIDFDKSIPAKPDSSGVWSVAPGCKLSDVGPLPPREP